ncbi:MAG TPA: hypothetical protein VFR55_14625 [Dehalococcoidia bacterium]|nr:hypothetical protein [Dehalococcoidia bacterium]
MSFKILTVPQPLLQPGDLVDMRGNWPQPWRDQIYRVTDTLPTIRDREEGIIGHNGEITIDPDATLGLNPEREEFIYQVRIGMNDFPGRFYVRWPSNDFTMQVQDPNFSIAQADTSASQRQLIGFLDHTVTRKENPTRRDPEPGLRFEFLWVKDQLPSFLIRGDSGALVTDIFAKVNIRYLTNICRIEAVTDPEIIDEIRSGSLLVSQAIHYSEIGRRGL